MAKFARAEKQAADVMKVLQGTVIKSVGTVRNYEQALTQVCNYVKTERISKEGLQGITLNDAITYLEKRGQAVGQKTLDMERQAIQMMMQHVTHKLKPSERLPVIQSEQHRAYPNKSTKSPTDQ